MRGFSLSESFINLVYKTPRLMASIFYPLFCEFRKVPAIMIRHKLGFLKIVSQPTRLNETLELPRWFVALKSACEVEVRIQVLFERSMDIYI
jgi:hypothetical protein